MVRFLIILGCLMAGLAVILILLPSRTSAPRRAIEGVLPEVATKQVGTSAIGHGGPDSSGSPRGTPPPPRQNQIPETSR